MFKGMLTIGMITCLSLTGQAAEAAWLFQDYESAFDDTNSVQAAMTVGRYGGFGVRCHSEELSVVYMLSDTNFDAETVEKSNSLGVFKLKVRVDKNTTEELEATASLPKAGMLMLVAAVSREHVEQIRDAKKQIAVAVSLIGQNYYEDKISVSGSTAVVQKVLDGCFNNDTAATAKTE
ncbi:hypothetical protein PX860_23520 [Agrobacterium leguminum]|uniref:hypothetical protein n=1 Tax=Agrobacterium leguminum TaxID=2792015 RepID=UPI00272C4A54|nr:hypothetical protein [Agrobacterium leguminum]WLE00044.1 hypothetical protein PX860_23520 [Agrobacterium leguminum]